MHRLSQNVFNICHIATQTHFYIVMNVGRGQGIGHFILTVTSLGSQTFLNVLVLL